MVVGEIFADFLAAESQLAAESKDDVELTIERALLKLAIALRRS